MDFIGDYVFLGLMGDVHCQINEIEGNHDQPI